MIHGAIRAKRSSNCWTITTASGHSLVASVRWERQAVAQLLQLSRSDRRLAGRINDAIYDYAEHRRGSVRKLQGYNDRWRLRIGDWRVIFRFDNDGVLVLEVSDRRDAYR